MSTSESNTRPTDDKKWFLFLEGRVSGPFDTPAMRQQLQETSPSSLVWGRGLPEWVSPQKWQRLEGELEKTILNQRAQNERMWRLRVNNTEMEPMLFEQMLTFLRTQNDFAEIYVWTEGYSDWKEVFQIHRIMDELGVPRRKHPRVPLMGQVSCEGATGSFTARALSISEGGLGISESPAVKIGEKFKIILKSPNLYLPIHATAEVVYVGNDGYVGLKFLGLQTESKSAIIEYVKKLLEASKAE